MTQCFYLLCTGKLRDEDVFAVLVLTEIQIKDIVIRYFVDSNRTLCNKFETNVTFNVSLEDVLNRTKIANPFQASR